jgi:hypothetical protein
VKLYDEGTDRIYVGRIVALCAAFIAAMWVLTVVIWGLGVATAGIYGKGEAHKFQQSSTNRITQNTHFFDLYGTIQAQTANIATASAQAAAYHAQWDAKPDDVVGSHSTEAARLDSVVLGLKNLCTENLTAYNNDAQKYIAAEFRDARLPDHLPVPGANCGA